MIQYYKDLIATVTYEECIRFIDTVAKNKKIKVEKRFDWFKSNRHLITKYTLHFEVFFIMMSEILNKPIDHIVHEMKNSYSLADKIECLNNLINRIDDYECNVVQDALEDIANPKQYCYNSKYVDGMFFKELGVMVNYPKVKE